MVLGFNNYGLLGDKKQSYEQVNALFQKLDQVRRVNLTTTDAGTVIAHQVFLPSNVAGVYQLRVHVTAITSADAIHASVIGFVGVTTNSAGTVTITNEVPGNLLGLKNVSGGSGATVVTVTAQNAIGNTPAAVNINVVGAASTTIYWSVTVTVENYSVNNPNQGPVGNDRRPPLT